MRYVIIKCLNFKNFEIRPLDVKRAYSPPREAEVRRLLDVPDKFKCPITLVIIKDPVVAEDWVQTISFLYC